MWILIDNEDSFSHILYDYIRRYHADTILMNAYSGVRLTDIKSLAPERLIISPGPGSPEEALLSRELLRFYLDKVPILGICLGHQILGIESGARCEPSGRPLHGITTSISIHKAHPIFEGFPAQGASVMHYHSLVLKNIENTALDVLATDAYNEVMAIAHRQFPAVGLQFHPESVLTEHGEKMIANWCNWQPNHNKF